MTLVCILLVCVHGSCIVIETTEPKTPRECVLRAEAIRTALPHPAMARAEWGRR